MKKLIYILLCIILISCSNDSAQEIENDYLFNDSELELIDRINQHRVGISLFELQILPHLGYLCSKNNQGMIEIGTLCTCYFIESVNSIDKLYNTQYVSQIILNNHSTPQSAMNSILSDALSRDIIERDYTDIGVSIIKDPNTNKKYYTILIIKR
jgi:DNA phosphorothioation-dependent restriction protein DptG